jgi:hypothetical protein
VYKYETIGGLQNVCRVLERTAKRTRPLGGPRRSWKDIEWVFKNWNGMAYTGIIRLRIEKTWDKLKTVLKFQVP